jgi:enamine deaminase RidA (YjgF/YER057c/UK114 family)
MTSNASRNAKPFEAAPDKRLLEGATAGLVKEGEEAASVLGQQHHTVIGYDGLKRLALMVTPEAGGEFRDQCWETVSTLRAILRQQDEPMAVTMQTVFLREAGDAAVARQIFEAFYGERMPLTLFVAQPPCDGRALAIEAWAISTRTTRVSFCGPQLVKVEHDGVEWFHAAAGDLEGGEEPAYEQAAAVFGALERVLREAGAAFEDVVRVWLYHGSITGLDEAAQTERYRELNRARTDFFAGIPFAERAEASGRGGRSIYPASTGIGTLGRGLMAGCMALRTKREDVRLLALENPLQTAACDYPKAYSEKSPKFARAMAMRMGNHVTTWVSGTASIVNAETVHLGDVEKQTEQTLDNIEQLISRENFARGGWADAGAALDDLAKVRVYVKRAEDEALCRAVCERRLGRIPAIYAVADVCRPDLLVEIEGVAFSELRDEGEGRPAA